MKRKSQKLDAREDRIERIALKNGRGVHDRATLIAEGWTHFGREPRRSKLFAIVNARISGVYIETRYASGVSNSSASLRSVLL